MTLEELHKRDGVQPNARATRGQAIAKATKAKQDQQPCKFLGTEPIGEIECPSCYNRTVKLKTFACGHPDKPLGEQVCKKKGCGPKCTGYTIAETPGTE